MHFARDARGYRIKHLTRIILLYICILFILRKVHRAAELDKASRRYYNIILLSRGQPRARLADEPEGT